MKRTAVAVFVGALGVFAVSGLAEAHKGAEGVVKERMDQMSELKSAMKSMGQMLKSGATPDPQVIEEAARKIEENSGSRLTSLFPEGSLPPSSDAKPEIWENWGEFEELAASLQAAGQKLGASASGSKAEVGGAFKALASSCKSCHEKFRLKAE